MYDSVFSFQNYIQVKKPKNKNSSSSFKSEREVEKKQLLCNDESVLYLFDLFQFIR